LVVQGLNIALALLIAVFHLILSFSFPGEGQDKSEPVTKLEARVSEVMSA
jgi:hypothetical protein